MADPGYAGLHEELVPDSWLGALQPKRLNGEPMTEDPIDRAKAAAQRGDFQTAIVLLRPLAEAGNPDAQNELASLALTECDLISGREAFTLFLAAAEHGHPEAMHHVATFPDFVSEPFKSPLPAEASWVWLLRAAEAGCVQAQYDVAANLATGDWGNGDEVPVDLKSAVNWYRRAAEAGHAEAQFNLASMLIEGEGCERDLAEAKEWITRSLAGGYAYARTLLAQLEYLEDSRRSEKNE